MSKAEHLRTLDVSFDQSKDVEAVRPSLSKPTLQRIGGSLEEPTLSETELSEQDQALFDDFNESVKEPEDVKPTPFAHLQHGLLSIFFQNEDTRNMIRVVDKKHSDKLVEIETKIDKLSARFEAQMDRIITYLVLIEQQHSTTSTRNSSGAKPRKY